MPVENFRIRKTTEHVGISAEQLVLSSLPTASTGSYKGLYVDGSNGIVYREK